MAHPNARLANSNSQASGGRLETEAGADWLVLRAAGRWDIKAAARLDGALHAIQPTPDLRYMVIDLAELEALDTAGAWLLRRTRREFELRGVRVAVENVAAIFRTLLDEVEGVDPVPPPAPKRTALLPDLVAGTGRATIALGRDALGLLGFFGLILSRLGRLCLQPGRLRLTSLVYHMGATGVSAMPIVGLLTFLIGVVLAYQGAFQLRQFGAEIFVVNLLGISILRELGILITAIIVAGRSGSAFTAQIGTMRVNQEVDAMQTLGLDPVDILVLPRLLALMLTLPLLAFFADLVGLFGGAVMSYVVLDIGFSQFVRQLQTAVGVGHFWVGIVKAPVFAFTIAMVGCYQGLRVSGSAESVGRLTTQSVVQSIFLVIVLDAIFSILFASVGF